MKITRALPIEEANIEVTLHYEGPEPANYNPYGDWQGEETGAVMTCGPMRVHVRFMVMPTPRPVAEWPLEEIELYHGTDFITGRKAINTFLSDLPIVQEAVEIAWAQVQAYEQLQAAYEDYASAGSLRSELEAQVHETGDGHHRLAAAQMQEDDAGSRWTELKRAYDETYPEPVDA